MSELRDQIETADARAITWMARYGLALLRISVGIVYLWFGFLKFFPGLSPAQDLAIRTMDVVTFGLIPGGVAIVILATWESLIGVGLIVGKYMRITLMLLWLQMVGAIMPIFLFPHEVFMHIPYAPNLEGQYIIKNIVIISAGIVLGAAVGKGRMQADPAIVRKKEAAD